MIVQCPSCDARFLVPDHAVGAEGRRVKCGKCQHVWKVKPAAGAIPDIDALMKQAPGEPVIAKPLAPGANLPKISHKSRSTALIFIIMILVVLSIMLTTLWLKPGMFGMGSTEGLVLQDIQFAKSSTEGAYIVQGKIVNDTNHPMSLPVLRITLTDDKRGALKSWDYKQANTTINPHESVGFETDPLTTDGYKGAHFIVEVGNSLELTLRRAKLWTIP